ncbi:2TM domain-containing protein [Spirosoma sp.]|uniref:2TM domain-containing protein n=1 Tax=Spirosoma sp. TaxID=1899569 RepID=UPI003B3B1B5F
MEPNQNNTKYDPYLWKQAKARVDFRMHLRTYLIVNTGLWFIWAFTNYVVSDSHSVFPWPIFALLGWGIGLASHYFQVYHGGSERSMIEEEYQRLISQRD